MNTTSVHHRRPLKRRRSIAALGLSGLLALAACGAQAEPASRPGYNSHLADLEELNRHASGDAKDHPRYVPVSPDQIEHRAVAQPTHPTPWWADPARHPANQDPAPSNASPWWAQKR